MSAYLVDKRHIDLLLKATDQYSRQFGITWSNGTIRKHFQQGEILHYAQQQRIGNRDDIGAMLWAENLQSVSERYPDDHSGERPGRVGLADADILAYEFTPQAYHVTPVEALKALACYEYQACEHDEWDQSEAKDFCESLRHALINALPGYEEAPWSWDDSTKERR